MSGSLIKRGKVWYLRYELPHGPDAPRRQKMLACPGMNKKQAEQKLRDILTRLHRGESVDSSRITLAEYLADWLRRAEARLSPTTWESYSKYIAKHVLPHIGHYKLASLRPIAIQALYDDLLTRGLAPKTIRNIHGILHVALGQAVRLQTLAVNPAHFVDPPRVPRPDIRPASLVDIARLLVAMRGFKYSIPVIIIMATGMRRGEALALRWEDFDPESGSLVVRRSLAQVRGRVFAKETKTGKLRLVLIPRSVVRILLEHRAEQGLVRRSFSEGGWICADEQGDPLTPQGIARAFGRLCAAHGIDVTLHGFRHTQASLLLAEGVPLRAVMERLGQTTSAITQDRYAHVLPHLQDRAVTVVESFLDPLLGDWSPTPGSVQNVCKPLPEPNF